MDKGIIMAFFRKKQEIQPELPVHGPIQYLIVGLGNPGKEYEYTRHNVGFLFVDVLCNRYSFRVDKLKFHALCGETMIANTRCLVMKPQTYMNLSGNAVGEAAAFYKIPPERVIVLFDDISLPFSTLRIRRKGSAGGHNGIKNIIYQLNSDAFPRIKIGVGDRADKEDDLKDYVLGQFSKDDLEVLKKTLQTGAEAMELIVSGQIEEAMNRFSR